MEEKKCEFINECVNFKENENLLTGDCHINELSIRCKNENRCKYAIVYQQLQLKDKMIELMAKDKIRYLINCKGFPETYLTKAEKDNFNCITKYYKEQALAELEE